MTVLARALRRSSTASEQRLWAELRNRRLAGFKFRRQHPVGPYVLEFVLIESRLVIELDGRVHRDRETYDALRTQHLAAAGFRLLKFRSIDVVRSIASVRAAIEAALTEPR